LKIVKCRLCQSSDIHKVVDLGFHPLADTFLEKDVQFGPEVSYPLQLGLCQSCGHVFTLFSISQHERYQKHDYSYDSSNSKVSVNHFQEFCNAILSAESLKKDSFIVDIGGNIGTLLGHFKSAGYSNVLNIEPSENIANMAIKNGIPTFNDFFNKNATSSIKTNGKVDVLLSSNVVNHADDLVSLLCTAKDVMNKDGIFVFEVPYLLDLIQETSFDTIYHEHVHYFGIKPLAQCLQSQGFAIYKVERINYMCGSIRVYASRSRKQTKSVSKLIEIEEGIGLYTDEIYNAFTRRVELLKFNVNKYLWKVRADGGKIIGIGAATKGNTLLNYCKLDSDLIEYVTDMSPLKIGKQMPGSHIPIKSDTDIDDSVTHALILPWNIADHLKKKLSHLNLKFYVPQVK